MQIVRDAISIEELKKMSPQMFGDLVKAVVDIEKEIMVVDAQMHADEETLLLSEGSLQDHLWSFNLYPSVNNETWIEFDSMINYRASMGNRSRGVDDPALKEKIIKIVNRLVTR